MEAIKTWFRDQKCPYAPGVPVPVNISKAQRRRWKRKCAKKSNTCAGPQCQSTKDEEVVYLFTLGALNASGNPITPINWKRRQKFRTLSIIRPSPFRRKDLNKVYKKFTDRFKKSLQKMVPSHIFSFHGVDRFKDAVDYVSRHGLSVDPAILQDLELSIRGRERMAFDFGDVDPGHVYLIDTLVYCWRVLSPLVAKNDDESSQRKLNWRDACYNLDNIL